jgi:hypothetical protein
MSLAAGMGALALWRYREKVRWIRIAAVTSLVLLHLVMKSPVWYLLARIDLMGGSTGWHRAELITQALNHISEWWVIGTDHTRHWMPSGVWWNEDHTDITNYYLKMGVVGGLGLMLAFFAIVWASFRLLGNRLHALRLERSSAEYVLWCLGSALFVHAVTFISVSYYDQTYALFWIPVGIVAALCAGSRVPARAPRASPGRRPALRKSVAQAC